MGYDVHITRAENWEQNHDREVSAVEWLALVGDDAELVPDPENGRYAVVWRPSQTRPAGWLDWAMGNVYTTNPDRELVEKMLEIASRLDARLQGDDGRVITNAKEWTGDG